jgi:hypothetical protein
MDPSIAENILDNTNPFEGYSADGEDGSSGVPGTGGGIPLFGMGGNSSLAETGLDIASQIPSVGGTTASGGFMGGLGKWLSKNGLDLGLGIMSLFGGDDDPFQKRQSYRGHGMADPVDSLNATLAAIQKMAQNVSERAPGRMSSSFVQSGPAPVSIPGIPFQIGGGLGIDPALRDPSLLQAMAPMGNPFSGGPSATQPGARRRTPEGNG